MIALNMPMQPSSNTPMIAFWVCNSDASFWPVASHDEGMLILRIGITWAVVCLTFPVASQVFSFFMNLLSEKSSAQSVLNLTPALVREPFRLSIPTSPGHCPDQLATVRIGPRWVSNPGSTWWEYCQTASATMIGISGSMDAKTSIPFFWESINPCLAPRFGWWARFNLKPQFWTALANAFSISCWAAQQTSLADVRRSPLAIRATVGGAEFWDVFIVKSVVDEIGKAVLPKKGGA